MIASLKVPASLPPPLLIALNLVLLLILGVMATFLAGELVGSATIFVLGENITNSHYTCCFISTHLYRKKHNIKILYRIKLYILK